MGVRWDAVVEDKGFWSEHSRESPEIPLDDASRPLRVQVWLFGSLNDGLVKSPVTLECPGPVSVRDVIAELGRVHGRAFLARVSDSGGDLFRNCRIFVNGQAVDDVAAPIQPGALHTEVELMLLTAAEGG